MVLTWMLLAGVSLAQGTRNLDVDPAVVWPAVGCASLGAVEGVDTGDDARCGGVRMEAQRKPVTEGPWAHVGGRIQLAPSFALHQGAISVVASVPLLSHFAGELGQSERIGIADPLIGARLRLLDDALVRFAGQLDVRVPVGTRESWMAERGLRARLSGVLELGEGDHRALLNAGLILRSSALPEPLSPAPWGRATVAWRARWHEQVQTQVAVHGRWVPQAIDAVQQGPVELRGDVRIGRETALEIGGGTALVRGLGSSGLIVSVGVHSRTASREPKIVEDKPEPIREPASAEACLPGDDACLPDGPVASPEPSPESAPEPAQEEDVQVRVASVLLNSLQFELGTSNLLSESEVALRGLITDLLSQPKVGPILIEGHASQEGSFQNNYSLSLSRADSIYRRLVDAGVSPTRLVLRPLGEVDDDAIPDLAARRRVEIRLVLDPLFADEVVVHPFTGEEIRP